MDKIYIYTLQCPMTGEVRYVGKTNNVSRRYNEHLRDMSQTNRGLWIQSLARRGEVPSIHVVEICSSSNWAEREAYWIRKYDKRGARLTNMTNGVSVERGYQPITVMSTLETIFAILYSLWNVFFRDWKYLR